MKVVSIVGARPQFIKAVMISRVLRKNNTEILVHTGQHYDVNMSDVFFKELEISSPDYHLGIGSGNHGEQTGAMLIGVEQVLIEEKPDCTLVYGDTNSTLAGALAASKLNIPIAHVEAGMRSFNRAMPEEINRVLTDHLSSLLFCPSQIAVDNLAKEGIRSGVHIVGDVMADVLKYASPLAGHRSNILERLGITSKSYILVTIHRAENTDNVTRLSNILTAISEIRDPIVFPIHPRTKKVIHKQGYNFKSNVIIIEPVGYMDMIQLEQSAKLIITDSGGIQKESYWLGIPCITLREETEWIETVSVGWNVLTGADPKTIIRAIISINPPQERPPLYGNGRAAKKIVKILLNDVRI